MSRYYLITVNCRLFSNYSLINISARKHVVSSNCLHQTDNLLISTPLKYEHDIVVYY